MSLSARRAWIEITTYFETSSIEDLSLSARRAWIEMKSKLNKKLPLKSLSARRAWIEITFPGFRMEIDGVALRKESVDRNFWWVEGDRFFY